MEPGSLGSPWAPAMVPPVAKIVIFGSSALTAEGVKGKNRVVIVRDDKIAVLVSLAVNRDIFIGLFLQTVQEISQLDFNQNAEQLNSASKLG